MVRRASSFFPLLAWFHSSSFSCGLISPPIVYKLEEFLLLVGWALGVKLLRSCLQQGAVQFASWFWGNPLQKGRVTDKVAIQCNSSLFSGLERPWWAGTPLGLVFASFCPRFSFAGSFEGKSAS